MKNIIEIRDFSFSYPESGKKTLKHINMAIQEGRNWVTQLMEETGYPTEKMPQKKVFR